ncbi:hypothetical protein PsYK624_162780 [Phanerochaete sordida]|uniref:Uncharacterized protein n=1 Tax=Phanerochaete sordida TaxID=48140 RepID=A0A9P3LM35_9APHY|nr:hypothetical protein PsYK624_162780 [Phanerochaete sordida]
MGGRPLVEGYLQVTISFELLQSRVLLLVKSCRPEYYARPRPSELRCSYLAPVAQPGVPDELRKLLEDLLRTGLEL